MIDVDTLLAEVVGRCNVRMEEVIGCSDQEIREVELDQGVTLPQSYRQFLQSMGKFLAPMWAGSFFTYPAVLGLREVAFDLLQENGEPFVLAQDALVFWSHQGYMFMFLDTSYGADPPVYFYHEGEPGPMRTFDRFSDFLQAYITGRDITPGFDPLVRTPLQPGSEESRWKPG